MRCRLLSKNLLWLNVLLSSELPVSPVFSHNEQISVRIAAGFHPVIKSVFLLVGVCLNGCVLHLKSHGAVLFMSLGRGAVHISSLTPHVFWSSLLIPACLGRCNANAVALISMFRKRWRESHSLCINCVTVGCTSTHLHSFCDTFFLVCVILWIPLPQEYRLSLNVCFGMLSLWISVLHNMSWFVIALHSLWLCLVLYVLGHLSEISPWCHCWAKVPIGYRFHRKYSAAMWRSTTEIIIQLKHFYWL